MNWRTICEIWQFWWDFPCLSFPIPYIFYLYPVRLHPSIDCDLSPVCQNGLFTTNYNCRWFLQLLICRWFIGRCARTTLRRCRIFKTGCCEKIKKKMKIKYCQESVRQWGAFEDDEPIWGDKIPDLSQRRGTRPEKKCKKVTSIIVIIITIQIITMIITMIIFTTIQIISVTMEITSRSSQLREQGNKAYTSKKNSQALKLYTESVRWVRRRRMKKTDKDGIFNFDFLS